MLWIFYWDIEVICSWKYGIDPLKVFHLNNCPQLYKTIRVLGQYSRECV